MLPYLFIIERNDFNITIGHQTGVKENPSCIEHLHITDVINNHVDVTCPTVMRGRYVGFIRPGNGTDRYAATLCEVVVMGIKIIGNELNEGIYLFIYLFIYLLSFI